MARVKATVGTVTQKHGAWYWRHYTGGKQVWEKLADESDVRRKEDAVKLANARATRLSEQPRTHVTIVDFCEREYMPRIQAKRHPSTFDGYRKLWSKHIRPHFGKRKLHEYRSADATQFFEQLADRGLGRHSIAHVRSFMSGLFRRAVNTPGLLQSNPIHDAETPHYTREEMIAALNALRGCPQGFVAMLLAFVGLRPAEIMGLMWQDVDTVAGVLHVRRGVWKGIVQEGDSGKKKHTRSIPVGPRVIALLEQYRNTREAIVSGFVLESEAAKPLDIWHLAKREIRPVLKAAGVEWKTFYGGRRGAETEMGRHTNGNTQITAHYFGHSKRVADSHYQKPLPEETATAGVAMMDDLAGALEEQQETIRDSKLLSY